MSVEVERKVRVPASVETVWQAIGDFGALADWHPGVATCDVERNGALVHRHLRTVDGGEILEREVGEHAEDHSYTYEILSSPLPVSQYRAILRVLPDGNGAKIIWSSEFEAAAGTTPQDAAHVVAGIYDAGLDALAKRFA
ncbi:MAG: SRPBCC family protein [Pseudomonadota bacterium]